MAEPIKNSFGPEVAARIADMVEREYADFDRAAFLERALSGYNDLELTQRARQISAALATCMPADRERAIEILIAGLVPENGETEPGDVTGFDCWPLVYFVADYGLECFETSMRAQYELTKRFTAEFSIRAYLERWPAETLARLREWTRDENEHVRRLVSEGSRPRLPWAQRLRAFQEDPTDVLELLELLKDDPAEYVRRSVANNLNDISRDHPERVCEVAARWWEGGSPERRRLVRHGLRTLIKQGHPEALAVLGYGADSPAIVRSVECSPGTVSIGGRVRIEVIVENPSGKPTGALVDLRVHFVKANGSMSPKVFKGAEKTLDPESSAKIRKTISLAQHSTRTHYPGTHRIEVLLNGQVHPGTTFVVVE